MPLVVATLAEPPDIQRLIVIVMVRLYFPATVNEGAIRPALLAGLRHEHTSCNSLLRYVLGAVVLGFSTPVEVVFVGIAKLRAAFTARRDQCVVGPLPGHSEVASYVLIAEAHFVQPDAFDLHFGGEP